MDIMPVVFIGVSETVTERFRRRAARELDELSAPTGSEKKVYIEPVSVLGARRSVSPWSP
ncbi:hypothetical protein IscW_ISCW016495 [Ixodes scapularis]|uniref:Uncharacterized protein n=1 Tax=Ixodes scapularis TaxID=6945 RepID=B7P759_IXOSC|nr:hypothetical protein IscW_ISCW016495 [Ixodes scapularis]|eukprot:XP_002409613.1 hypothetical protein IscW_ISCW016495 [Ixodes scapularis]